MLLSAGGFALYLGESNIFNLLAPRFGDLAIRKNRERMWQVWVPEVKNLFRRVPSPPTYPLQSKKNIVLSALRKPLTSKGADVVVLVDENASVGLHAGARPTAECNLPQEGSTLGRMAGQA
jgi:hypothetical protein